MKEPNRFCPTCKQELFWDDEIGVYLCRARFDGLHETESERQERILAAKHRAASLGGQARAAKLSPAQRSAISSNAVKTRWEKKRRS